VETVVHVVQLRVTALRRRRRWTTRWVASAARSEAVERPSCCAGTSSNHIQSVPIEGFQRSWRSRHMVGPHIPAPAPGSRCRTRSRPSAVLPERASVHSAEAKTSLRTVEQSEPPTPLHPRRATRLDRRP